MKKFLFGAAAAAAMIAPGAATAETNAVVGAQYTNVDFDGFDFDNYGLNGGFSHDFSNGTMLQVDGEMGRFDTGGGSCCVGFSYGAVHYGVRNDSYSYAGFIGLQDFFGYSGAEIGVEGQWFFSSATLNGSLGFMDFDDLDVSATNVGLDGAWFFTPNFALTGVIGYTEIESGGSDFDATTLGVGGEWRFSNSPASLVFGYRNADFDGGDSDAWTIGFNVDLGTESLQERSRSGASLTGAAMFHAGLRSIAP